MDLDIRILNNNYDLFSMLLELARQKFNAREVYEISGTDHFNIDAGMNDIRARYIYDTSQVNVIGIEFCCRYERDKTRYETKIIEFCQENSIVFEECTAS